MRKGGVLSCLMFVSASVLGKNVRVLRDAIKALCMSTQGAAHTKCLPSFQAMLFFASEQIFTDRF